MQSLYGQADERLKAEALQRRIAARTAQIAALLDEKIRQERKEEQAENRELLTQLDADFADISSLIFATSNKAKAAAKAEELALAQEILRVRQDWREPRGVIRPARSR